MNQLPDVEGIWVSPVISALKRAPAETLLIAFVCQQASLHDGQCAATNKELGQAIGVHPQTVSGLIDRLHKAKLLEAVVETDQANQRRLTPSPDLLTDYERFTHSPFGPSNSVKLPYEQIAHSRSPHDSSRQCPLTGLDISLQGSGYVFATATTINTLFQRNRPRFDEVVSRLGLPVQDDPSLTLQRVIEQLHLANRPHASTISRPSPSRDIPPRPARQCPVTGLDITAQRPDCLFATQTTLTNLLRDDRARFNALVTKFLPPAQASQPPAYQCSYLAKAVFKVGKAASDRQKAVGGRRICPITKLDISHQQERHQFVTTPTLQKLFDTDRNAFDQVASSFSLHRYPRENRESLCFALAGRIRKAIKTYRKSIKQQV